MGLEQLGVNPENTWGVRKDKSKMPDITKTFIVNLTRFAGSKDITITRLCEIIETQQSSFYRWKSGGARIQMETAQKCVKLLAKEYEEDFQLAWFLMES